MTYDLALHVRLPRMTAGIAKRKVREIEPWNAAMLDNVPRRSDNNSRDPVRFEVTTRCFGRLLFATRTPHGVRCKNAKFAAYAALSGVIC